MRTIAVVDDRPEVRATVEDKIARVLKEQGLASDWQVISADPLASLTDYPPWVAANEVLVLVVDQRLDESGVVEVSYAGNDVVATVHPRMFDLPVYYLTAVLPNADVERDGAKVRAILDKDEFYRDPTPWVKEFVREGLRYEQHTARKLARLTEIAEAVVTGTVGDEELKEASSLRQELQLPFESLSEGDEQAEATRSDLLDALNAEVDVLEKLANRIQADMDTRGKQGNPRQ